MRAALALFFLMCTPASSPPIANDSSAPNDVTMNPIDASMTMDAGVADIHLIGRFDLSDPSAPAFAFSGTAIVTRFNGTGIAADLETGGSDAFAVVVDNQPAKTVKPPQGRGVRTLATGLPQGAHDLAIYKRTESFVGTVKFHGFSVENGSISASPFPFAHRMEFIGDSITCGYGDEGMGPNCGFTPDTENEYGAWGGVGARALNAAHTAICYSGKGVIRNFGGGTTETMPTIFQRTLGASPLPPWTFSAYTPDVVVINLGTNDYSTGDPGTAFSDGYLALLKLVRQKYPGAWIVCALGTMMGQTQIDSAHAYIQTAMTKMNDPRVSYLELGVQNQADGLGCDWHPSLVTAQKMGSALASHKQKLGW